jgi:ABC-type sulfate transport system permease subunit
MVVLWLLYIAVIVVMIVALWKVFTKAGKPGWAAIVPFYNYYVLLEVAGKPGWWLVLLLIPIVNIVFAILALVALAQRFGQGGGFAVGLIFLPFIFWPILAFGSAQYTAPPKAA